MRRLAAKPPLGPGPKPDLIHCPLGAKNCCSFRRDLFRMEQALRSGPSAGIAGCWADGAATVPGGFPLSYANFRRHNRWNILWILFDHRGGPILSSSRISGCLPDAHRPRRPLPYGARAVHTEIKELQQNLSGARGPSNVGKGLKEPVGCSGIKKPKLAVEQRCRSNYDGLPRAGFLADARIFFWPRRAGPSRANPFGPRGGISLVARLMPPPNRRPDNKPFHQKAFTKLHSTRRTFPAPSPAEFLAASQAPQPKRLKSALQGQRMCRPTSFLFARSIRIFRGR